MRKADQFSAACMQNAPRTLGPWTEEFMHQGEHSEDCLYLNVWAPAVQGKRPVFVWIHGGGFDQGSTAVALYDGLALARQGIVVVSINYRVREFGFLVHPELLKESGRGVAGNYGLLDQIAALKWVQANIAAFGGDPAKVTIGGQSAGAASVMALMASPLTKGLFHQAILQSGLNAANRWRPLAAAAADGERHMASKGARTLQELRSLPAESVMTPMDQMPYRPAPVVDGWVLPEAPSAVFARGEGPDVALLAGWTADEGSSSATYGKRTPEEFQKDVRDRVAANGWSGTTADDLVARFLRLYPAATTEAAGESQKTSARDQGVATTYLLLRKRATRATTARLHLPVDTSDARTEAGGVRGVPLIRTRVRVQQPRQGRTPLGTPGPRHRKDDERLLGQLRPHRRPERRRADALASVRRGTSRHDGTGRALRRAAHRRPREAVPVRSDAPAGHALTFPLASHGTVHACA